MRRDPEAPAPVVFGTSAEAHREFTDDFPLRAEEPAGMGTQPKGSSGAGGLLGKLGKGVLSATIVLVFTLFAAVLILRLSGGAGPTAASGWAPLPSSHARISRLAWGSCSKQELPQGYWKVVLESKPDILVLEGDNVYGDCSSPDCAELPRAYDALAASPDFQEAKRKQPMIPVWDDHDYGVNDGGVDNPWKDLAKDLFVEFYGLAPDDARRHRPGLYQQYQFGPQGQRLQLLALDTRWFRSPLQLSDEPMAPFKERYVPSTNSSTTMLGEEQWKWLRDAMLEPADVRVILSSIQVLADGHGWECWRMLSHERDRLYSLIAESASTAGGTTVLLTGDRHVGGVYVTDDGLVEATASSWTHTVPDTCRSAAACDEPGPNRIGNLVRENHFGMLEIDWSARQAVVALLGAATAGEVLVNHTIPIGAARRV